MATIEARAVWKTYDRVRWILRDVSLKVDRGQIAVVVGRSGSGKTTLLNVLAALERPTRGSVSLDGVDLEALDPGQLATARLAKVGVVFQRFFLIPELTVAENVRLPMKFAKRRDAKQRTEELLKFFGLSERADAFPATLSGGETQRAAIARALGNEPPVLLADEPTANLDDANAENALDALREVADVYGTAILIASHDSMVRDIGDRVYRIADGRVTQDARREPAKASKAL